MLEKLNTKIEEEIEKVIKRNDLTIEDLKSLIDIKNGLEMKEILKTSVSNSVFYPIDFEKGELQYDTNNN